MLMLLLNFMKNQYLLRFLWEFCNIFQKSYLLEKLWVNVFLETSCNLRNLAEISVSFFFFISYFHFTEFSTKIHWSISLAASNLFHMFTQSIKGTLMQIWKSANIFVFTGKYAEKFTLKHLLRFEISACEICEKFVYKHSEKRIR